MNGSIEMNKSMKQEVNLAILYWRILAIMHNPWTKYIMQRGVMHEVFCFMGTRGVVKRLLQYNVA